MHKPCSPLRRVLAANANTSSFTAVVPQLARPDATVTDGVLDLTHFGSGLNTHEFLKLWAVGTGASNDAFSVRIWGWSRVVGQTSTARDLWVPSIVGELAFILGALTGIAGTLVPSTEFIADTVTIVTEGTVTQLTTREGTIVTYSPAADLIGWALVPVQGFELLQFTFDQTTNSPTMNLLAAPY